MNRNNENAAFEPELITVEVTEDDFIREAKDENAPPILGQLKYFFWQFKHEYHEGNRYSFMTTLFEDPDFLALCVSYDRDKKLIQLCYDFMSDDPLMAYFFIEDSFEDIPTEDIESTRAVTSMLPALVNQNMDTAWLCYDKENDSMWITAGIYVTGPKLNKKYLARVMGDIVRCRDLCLHILENVAYGTSASETEINIKALIESYSGSREAAAPDTLD
jgi:hypothetical protein